VVTGASWNWRRSWFWTIPVTIWGLLSLPLTAVAILLAAPFLGGRRSFFTIAPMWARIIFRLVRVDHRIYGWDDLPEAIRLERQPVIFMANHESNLDPPVLVGVLPIPAVYLAKEELKWMVPIGWAAMMAGTIFIDRGNRDRAIASLHRAADQIRGGKNVLLFPEGTRTRTGEMLPFKKGGFALAQEAGVPIVPLAAIGGYDMLPPGTVWIRPGRYIVLFGAPVRPEDFETREALMEEVQERIRELRQRALAY
jgi:1-acyl-sn-glycerol-3-phosphate acyltransferase